MSRWAQAAPSGHELAQEEPGGDGPGQAAGRDVVQVGVGGLERLLVLLDERQLPERPRRGSRRSGSRAG